MALSCGDIFYYSVSRSWDCPPHPKVVLASEDGVVAFVHATADKQLAEQHCRRVEGKRHGQPLNTLVFLPVGCCPAITQDCWVDCSDATYEEEVLIEDDGSFCSTGSQIPAAILAQIRVGVSSSHVVADKVRRMAQNAMPKPRGARAGNPTLPT